MFRELCAVGDWTPNLVLMSCWRRLNCLKVLCTNQHTTFSPNHRQIDVPPDGWWLSSFFEPIYTAGNTCSATPKKDLSKKIKFTIPLWTCSTAAELWVTIICRVSPQLALLAFFTPECYSFICIWVVVSTWQFFYNVVVVVWWWIGVSPSRTSQPLCRCATWNALHLFRKSTRITSPTLSWAWGYFTTVMGRYVV